MYIAVEEKNNLKKKRTSSRRKRYRGSAGYDVQQWRTHCSGNKYAKGKVNTIRLRVLVSRSDTKLSSNIIVKLSR